MGVATVELLYNTTNTTVGATSVDVTSSLVLTSFSYTFTTTPNTAYYYWLKLTNEQGGETTTALGLYTTQDNTAPVIATFTAAQGTDTETEIDLAISVTDNDAVNQIYTLLVTDSGARSIAQIQAGDAHAPGTTAVTYSNLTPDTVYYGWITADDTVGNDAAATRFTPSNVETTDTTPPVIASFTAAQGTDTETQIDLAMSVSDNSTSVANIYTLLATDASAKTVADIQLGDIHSGVTTAVTYSNLSPNTQYWAWMTADDANGNDAAATRSTPSNVTTADITAPVIATSTMALSGTDPDTEIDMTISVTDNDAVNQIYTLLVTDSGARTIANIQAAETHAAGTTAVTYSNLTPGTQYWGWITADDAVGNDAAATRFTPNDLTPYGPDITKAVDFDGTDYGAGNGTNTYDSKVMLLSAWFRRDTAGQQMSIFRSSKLVVDLTAADVFRIVGFNSASTLVLQTYTNPDTFADTNWHHVLFSYNAATSALHCYVDDVSRTMYQTPFANDFVRWDESDYGYGASTTGTLPWDGCLAEVFITREYLDITVEANRRKFISAAGAPVSLGTDGSTPTGTQPDIYLSGVEAGWNAGKNFGSGGSFTMTGAVTDCASTPYYAPAVDFDGTTDVLTGNGTNTYDVKVFTCSVWVKLDVVDAFQRGVFGSYNTGSDGDVRVSMLNGSVVVVGRSNGSAVDKVLLQTANSVLSTGTWYHILASYDTSTGASEMYINNVQQSLTTDTVTTDALIRWDESNYDVGRWNVSFFNGCMAELYVNREYIDLTVASNREKFIKGGKPVPLGSDGSAPTGTSPDIYFRGDATVWNAGTNLGTGGSFTMTGAVTDCATAP